MSCHVMSCRHYCIDSHKNILETFLSIKNFIKHFAGIFTRTRCAPRFACLGNGDNGKSKSCNYKSFCNDKNFQFDKYWRLFFKNELFFNELFSVIYKKNLLIWRFCL